MKVIVGLGNPGARYEKTRHNAGFLAVDRLARRHAAGLTPRARFNAVTLETPIRGQRCVLLKPGTYMNRSGQSVAEAVRFYKADPKADLLVLVDDLALPCGSIRIRPSGGAGGHNGLADIQRALGSDEYPRLRIGIDPKPAFMDQADYVLGRFTDEQFAAVEPALERAADAVEAFVESGVEAAMNRFNAKDPPRASRPASGTGETPPRPGASGSGPAEDPAAPATHPGWLGGSSLGPSMPPGRSPGASAGPDPKEPPADPKRAERGNLS